MTFKRRLSEAEQEEDAIAADVEARENGQRAYRHWKDRGEPPARTPAVAMRQACPYPRGDVRASAFFAGWRGTGADAFDHAWVGTKWPERKGKPCRVLARVKNTVEVEFPDGERTRTVSWWVRRISA